MPFGIPFNLFWLISWILLTPLCMWGAYKVEVREHSVGPRGSEDASR
jgi:hypothetical protein